MSAEPQLAALAALFSYPDAALLGSDTVSRAAPPAELTRALASARPHLLEGEYVRLFINALPEVACPPYASVYLEGGLMGACVGRIRDAYRRWGVDTDEMPDHFAVECAFLAELAGVLDTDPAAREDFDWLLDHLATWTPAFLDRVERHDRSGVYREAARFARVVIQRRLADRGDPSPAV